MLFNSYVFLFAFLPLVWVLFRALSGFKLARAAMGLLTVGSLFFYAYWNPPFVALLAGSVVFNFLWGRWLIRDESRPRWKLAIGGGVNLASIAYFKYTGFVLENVNALTGAGIEIPEVFLPLGISFFTFQQIAYLVDTHRGRVEEHSFGQYCLFVTFFPKLFAGPIALHSEVMPVMEQARLELIQQFETHSVAKTYLVLVRGHLTPEDGIIEAPIGRDPRNRKRMAVITKGRDT